MFTTDRMAFSVVSILMLALKFHSLRKVSAANDGNRVRGSCFATCVAADYEWHSSGCCEGSFQDPRVAGPLDRGMLLATHESVIAKSDVDPAKKTGNQKEELCTREATQGENYNLPAGPKRASVRAGDCC